MSLNKRSEEKLKGVHPDLVSVVRLANSLTLVDFVLTCGLRTVIQQQALVASGASKTMRSRHLTGHAVDVAPYIDGEVRWDWPPFHKIADAFKLASKQLSIPIEWGGDWVSFKDGPHFQLPWKEYP